ncbi:MAG: TraM recognition domain-containing protein [Pseudomonadota bacterium]|nr:TraM recognition domain-containing protein [Pseudomonadota bacterium]
MADKKQDNQGSDHFVFCAVGIVLLLILLDKFEKWFRMWITTENHQIVLAGTFGSFIAVFCYWVTKKHQAVTDRRKRERAVIGKEKDDGSVYCGKTEKNEGVYIKPRQRGMHTQVVGTTNAGKTESVILPWAIQDIEQGRGLLLIDGKADRSLLDKLWAYTVKAGRKKDFRLFSLSNTNESLSFNPLLGGTAEEITERVFNAFEFENPFYRSVQYEVLAQVLRIFEAAKVTPTFLKLHQAISNPAKLDKLVENCNDVALQDWVLYFTNLAGSERDQRTSGLTSQLSHFAFGKASLLFNQDKPHMTIDEALKNNKIVYFQLPALLSPFLGKATGKLVLQSLQAAVANRHRSKDKNQKFFSVFLDDFSEYLYPGFVTVLNKSRSANVGIVFAHQALGDIEAMGDSVANAILTNSNIKVFMRGNDPNSAEYFSKVIGTNATMKFTEKQKVGIFRNEKTGDVSAREAEEFIVHPNHFKRELGVGQAIMVVPHDDGARTIRLKFDRFPDLEAKAIPKTKHPTPVVLEASENFKKDKMKKAEPAMLDVINQNKKEVA